MRHLSLSGWGQSPAALSPDATDYMQLPSLEALFSTLPACEYAIGWSLGGQLLVRAILAGIIAPQALILIATPYRFQHPDFARFYQETATAPDKTLHRFQLMMCSGDSNRKAILQQLPPPVPSPHRLYWLEELAHFDGSRVDCRPLPPTLLIQGGKDTIVAPAQATEWAAHIPLAQLFLLDQAGHIPHLHACTIVQQRIEGFIHSHVS